MNRFDNIYRLGNKYCVKIFDSYEFVYERIHEFSNVGHIFDWDWMDKYMKTLPNSDRI